MSFQTDTDWPESFAFVFKASRNIGNDGAYDRLFRYCFSRDSHMISLDTLTSPDTADSISFYNVMDTNMRPVLVFQTMNDCWAKKPGFRFRADKQLRACCDYLLPNCPLPRLMGLSFLGTSMRVYCADKQTSEISPPLVPASSRNLPPDFLEGEWEMDILSQEAFAKMKEIINGILEAERRLNAV